MKPLTVIRAAFILVIVLLIGSLFAYELDACPAPWPAKAKALTVENRARRVEQRVIADREDRASEFQSWAAWRMQVDLAADRAAKNADRSTGGILRDLLREADATLSVPQPTESDG